MRNVIDKVCAESSSGCSQLR